MEARALSPRVWPLYLATFLSTYTFAVANISVPGIQHALGLPGSRTTLVIGAYAVSFTAGLIICGRLGDRFGRRRLFRIGTAAMLVCALLTAAAPNLPLLVAARLLQGCAAALTTPQVLSTIQATLSGEARAKAIGGYSIAAGIGTVGGNILGGAILSLTPEPYGWRAAFASIAVIAAIAWAGTGLLAESKSPNPEGFDLRGSALIALTMLLLITGLTNAAALNPLNPFETPRMLAATLALLAGAGLGFLVLRRHLVGRERREQPSVVPIRVVEQPAVALGIVLAALFFMLMASFMYNYAVLTQEGHGWSAAKSGLSLMGMATAFIVSSHVAPRVLAAIGPKVLVRGAFLQAFGYTCLAVVCLLDATPFIAWMLGISLIVGTGQGLMFGPLISVIMRHVPDSVAGITGGLIATGQQAGMGIGVATLSSLFTVLLSFRPEHTAFAWVLGAAVCGSFVFAALASKLTKIETGGR